MNIWFALSNQITSNATTFIMLYVLHISVPKNWLLSYKCCDCFTFCNALALAFDLKKTFKTICFERPACRNVNHQCHYQTMITDKTCVFNLFVLQMNGTATSCSDSLQFNSIQFCLLLQLTVFRSFFTFHFSFIDETVTEIHRHV